MRYLVWKRSSSICFLIFVSVSSFLVSSLSLSLAVALFSPVSEGPIMILVSSWAKTRFENSCLEKVNKQQKKNAFIEEF